MTLQDLLDLRYGQYGDDELQRMLAEGANPNQFGDGPEAPIHVAARRRRVKAVEILLEHDADINARNAHGKTAYAHAIRRKFGDVVAALRARGADTTLDTFLDTHLNPADEFAVAIVEGHLDAARRILAEDPRVIRTGNPEEDRLLADMAGRLKPAPVMLLIRAGADVTAPGLDGGTPLHQAAWFGSPLNARMLIAAGAPLELLDSTHHSTPLGWATHGSRYSGEADQRPEVYVEIVEMLLDAGAIANDRMLKDASEQVRETLVRRLGGYFSREQPIRNMQI
jgi:ankyrin repeat protein